MYYLVNINIFRSGDRDNESFHRLVKAKDKNTAYAKTKKYLLEIYMTPGNWTSYNIDVEDTII